MTSQEYEAASAIKIRKQNNDQQYHWAIYIIPIIAIFITFVLSAVAVDSCHFMLVESSQSSTMVYGLFRYGLASNNDICGTWKHLGNTLKIFGNGDDDRFPAALITAQVGGIFACLLGLSSFFLFVFSLFFERLLTKNIIGIIQPILLILASFFQFLTFVAFGGKYCKNTPCENDSNDICTVATCSFLEGAEQSLSAALLYLAIGVGIIFYPKPSEPLLSCRKTNLLPPPEESQNPPSIDEIEELLEAGPDEEVPSIRPLPPPANATPPAKSDL